MIGDLLQSSLRDEGVHDELSENGLDPRPHWAPLIESLQSLGTEEIGQRDGPGLSVEFARTASAITSTTTPWERTVPGGLTSFRSCCPRRSGRYIEAGIIQRAQVLELLLADLYGPQELLREGRVPPELLFANPAFLRPVAGLKNPNGSFLHLIAVDLARSPDGQWWVLADRTQAPSGAGYAIENRTLVADVLPEVFQSSNVHRLASFFRAQREALASLAGRDHPRVVLLTPGPLNETYFEHSYLARYLGFTLVEGADLTVRDRRVYLKSVEGLREVHVILRRVDDSFCDPLELRGDSYLGVPGLVEAVVAGHVRVANALGSGLIETAAIMPFLPGLTRHLLGEQLRLPSVATWWCGQDYALNWVLDHLEGVVVKPAFPSRMMEPVFGGQLATAEKQQFADRLRSRPYEFVAQEEIALSKAPVWDNGSLLSRSMVLRTYVLNTGSGWIAMPGGLVRVAGSDGQVVSMQQGGHSKDAWVLSDQAVDTFSLLRPRNQPVELRRGAADLPSRIADNLFWLGRYAERAENVARLLRTCLGRVRRVHGPEFRSLLRLHSCFETQHGKLPKKEPPTPIQLEAELISLMGDAKRPDSLVSILDDVLQVGSRVRDRLSSDMMRLLGELVDSAKIEEYMLFAEYSAALSGTLELLSAFSGMERENITRGPGWLFMSLGRRVERGIYLTRQLRELSESFAETDWSLWEYLLEVADSSITYRSRYYTTLQPLAVLDVLLSDGTNPRSLAFQLEHLVDLYAKLPRHTAEDLRSMQTALKLLRRFDLLAVSPRKAAVPAQYNSKERARLKRSLKALEKFLPSWSNNLSNTYFNHARTLPITIGG